MTVMRPGKPDRIAQKQRNATLSWSRVAVTSWGPELVLFCGRPPFKSSKLHGWFSPQHLAAWRLYGRPFLSRKTDSKKICADYSPSANVFCTPWRTGRDNTSWLSLSHPFSRCCALDKGLHKTWCEFWAEVNLLPGLIFKLHLHA